MSDKTTAHSDAVAWQRRDLSQPHPQLGIQQWSHWREIGANEFETLRDYKIANPLRKDIEVRELYPAPTHAEEIRHSALRLKALEQAMEQVKFKVPYESLRLGIEYVQERADEIMRGEPVATSCADHVKGETGYCTFSAKVPWGTRLFAAPSIDLAAVRDVIASHIEEAKKLRHDPESQDYLYEQASKLEAAIKGVA